MKRLTLLLTLLLTCFAQAQSPYLIGGGVTFASPVVNAFEFVLVAGLYQPQQVMNGFYWGNGSIHLSYKSFPGGCIRGCTFYGRTGKLTTVQLDANCQQISFPISHGRLVANPHIYKDVAALYSQTFCQAGPSLFMAGGSLVVYGAGI